MRSNLVTGQSIGLPPVTFLFTIDQIASMINVEEQTVKTSYLYFMGRTTGLKKRSHMIAVNIAAEPNDKADWRVSHQEFVAWLRRMGFRKEQLSILS